MLIETRFANTPQIHLVKSPGGARTQLTFFKDSARDAKNKVAYSNAVFSKDGKGIYVATDRDSEFKNLAYIELSTKKYTYLLNKIDWDIDSLALSWDGKKSPFL